jgi:transcriptional regulator with XRE-family HTH domain
MSPERYCVLIEHFGWHLGREAADALGVDPRTERRWVKGDVPIPFSIALLLELVHALGFSWREAMRKAGML